MNAAVSPRHAPLAHSRRRELGALVLPAGDRGNLDLNSKYTRYGEAGVKSVALEADPGSSEGLLIDFIRPAKEVYGNLQGVCPQPLARREKGKPRDLFAEVSTHALKMPEDGR